MKKVMVSLLVVALVIGCFAGCGKKEKGDLQQQAVSRDYVYKQEVISYNGSGTAPSGLIQIGDKVYGYSYEWREMDGAVTPRADIEGGGNTEKEAEAEDVDTATEETVAEPEPGTEEAAEDIAESYSSMIFYEILEDGTFGEGHELQGAPDQSINSFAADSQGNLYCLRNVYVYDDGSDTSEDLYYLEQKTLDDETVFSVNLNELPEIKKIVEQQGWLYINGLFAEEDALYLVCGSSILKFDKNGNMVGNVIRQDAEMYWMVHLLSVAETGNMQPLIMGIME